MIVACGRLVSIWTQPEVLFPGKARLLRKRTQLSGIRKMNRDLPSKISHQHSCFIEKSNDDGMYPLSQIAHFLTAFKVKGNAQSHSRVIYCSQNKCHDSHNSNFFINPYNYVACYQVGAFFRSMSGTSREKKLIPL